MVSSTALLIFVIALISITGFTIWCARAKQLHLMHKLFLTLALCYAEWIIPLMIMRFVNQDNESVMFILDCFTAPGGLFAPAIYLCIVLAFVGNYEKMPKWFWTFYIVPTIGVIITFTNNYHHLQYEVFSVIKEQIVFGPFVMISGAHSYLCLLSGIIILFVYAVRNGSRLCYMQCALLAGSGFVPMVISSVATFSNIEVPITATPLGFSFTLILNGIAIYQMHLLDIKPMATKQILNMISDCYIVLSERCVVIDYNKPFSAIFASKYGISKNRNLSDSIKEEDVSKKTAVYNMLTAIESCRDAGAIISYEQAMTVQFEDGLRKCYYVTEVSPLKNYDKIGGFAIVFKDVTKLRESIRQLQDSRDRMMEQERLAFLGQMIGGLAHNLKTPIMGISGCISAEEVLLQECRASLDDPDVTKEDYLEIYAEAEDWQKKMKESLAYMSDIITAIKGQTTTAMNDGNSSFTIDEVIKRCMLLMRHELMVNQCQLIPEYDQEHSISIKGDLNNLVQVLNNLISNAIYAQQKKEGGPVTIRIDCDKDNLNIAVIDRGIGVSDQVKEKLFKVMVTNKGNQGTGLGLYFSNAIIRGNFGGEMWMKDNPEGGAIFGVSIPKNIVTVTAVEEKEEDSEKEQKIQSSPI